MQGGGREAVVPYYFLVWYNNYQKMIQMTIAVVPYYFLVWYNQKTQKKAVTLL